MTKIAENTILRQVVTELKEGEKIRLRVNGDSMYPTIRRGDVLIVQRTAPGDIHLGDVVTVQRENDWVTHRLIAITPAGDGKSTTWTTKGDNMLFADPPVEPQAVIGRVVGVERNGLPLDAPGIFSPEASQRAAQLGRWEANFFQKCGLIYHRLGSRPPPGWLLRLARLVILPYRFIMRG